MRKMNLKIVILTGVLVLAMLLLGATKSQAALQANPTTHASPVAKGGPTWMTEIRQMETTGQTMGLNETLSGLNATSESNHIDVHMMLPTEYGAIAILSASGYGNPGKLRDETNVQKRTTTGNPTGVYFTGDKYEWMGGSTEYGNIKYSYTCDQNGILGRIGPLSSLTWHRRKVSTEKVD